MPDDSVDEVLQKGLRQAKKKPRNFAIVAMGTTCVKLIVSKKPIKQGELVQAKKDFGGNVIYRGTCSGSGDEMVFSVVKEPSLALPKFKQYLAETSGLRLKPRFEVVSSVEEVDDEGPDAEPDESESGPDQGVPPPTDKAGPMLARLKKLKPGLEVVIGAAIAVSQEAKLRASEFATLLRKEDFTSAGRALDQLQELIRQGLLELNARKSGESGGGFDKLWNAAKQAWRDASDTVDGQIAALQKALHSSGDGDFEEIAELGLNAVTGNFKVPLLAVLRDIDSATGDARQKAIGKARTIVAGFRKHISEDERVLVCDENPLDVPVTIQKTLGAALDQLDKALEAGTVK